MRQLFEQAAECGDCGGLHKRKCPRVKREVLHANGNRTEVEYWQDGQYDDSCILWPEDVYDDD